jgi:N-acetylneuraminic acid mutarotase
VEVVSESEFTDQVIQATWQKLESTNAGPGPRYQHAMHYNAITNQVFVFGGQDDSQVYNDVWALDLAALTWRQLAVDASVVPPARFSAVMMVDTPAENLYVATGQKQDGSVLGDIWRLDLQTETWEDLSSVAGQGPTARYGAAGGDLDNNLVVTHGFGTTRYDDTWLFNTSSHQWENITPTSAVPLKRCLLAATTNAGSLVLHGGCSSGFGPCPQDDTWILDSASQTWWQISGEIQPAARQHHSLTSIADENQVMLFGGQDAGQAARDDVWLLDLATDRWQPVEGANGPEARYKHGAVWTPIGLLIYGGQNNGALTDMWRLTLNE